MLDVVQVSRMRGALIKTHPSLKIFGRCGLEIHEQVHPIGGIFWSSFFPSAGSASVMIELREVVLAVSVYVARSLSAWSRAYMLFKW